jgi:hypothetical protein
MEWKLPAPQPQRFRRDAFTKYLAEWKPQNLRPNRDVLMPVEEAPNGMETREGTASSTGIGLLQKHLLEWKRFRHGPALPLIVSYKGAEWNGNGSGVSSGSGSACSACLALPQS